MQIKRTYFPLFIFTQLLIIFYPSSTKGTTLENKNYIIGVDAGTESVRVGIFNSRGDLVKSASVSYPTEFPNPSWAEQHPNDWWDSLADACKIIMSPIISDQSMPIIEPSDITGIAVDSTACSVVLLDQNHDPLRPCLLWMDCRSAEQCSEIYKLGKFNPSLNVNCGGNGPLSAEWMIPKSLWVKQNEPHIWNKARYICEKQDFFNLKLTGRLCSSGCNVAARWHWNAQKACEEQHINPNAGRPLELLKSIRLEDLNDKWPSECVAMGDLVGRLSQEAALHLGLPPNIPVTQGGPDAYVGMIGLGCVEPGELSLITGSSHLHLAVSEKPTTSKGIWGAYNGAPLMGLCFAEGGQSSTGSVISWARRILDSNRRNLSNDIEGLPPLTYEQLDSEAREVRMGCDGVICLETFQGARTPETDPLARGSFLGLSLAHTRGHIWRSIMEAVCFGTKAAIDALNEAGHGAREIKIAGGATRSDLWLQMHADVTGLPVVVTHYDNAPLLGSALLAGVGAGLFDSDDSNNNDDDIHTKYQSILKKVRRGIQSMVRISKRIEPNPEAVKFYEKIYLQYRMATKAVKEISHSLATGQLNTGNNNGKSSKEPLRLPTDWHIVPSLLAADFGNLALEAKFCKMSGASWIHVDICDGGALCHGSLTVGPQTIAAIRRDNPDLNIDVHVVSRNPNALIASMAAAGATRFIFQYENILEHNSPQEALNESIRLAKEIRSHGMLCGVCIAPNTSLSVVLPLLNVRIEELDSSLQSPLIDMIDILAVNPGFGGQTFDVNAIEKVKVVKALQYPPRHIAVDGGINVVDTAALCANAGANMLIAGTSIFGNNRISESGPRLIQENMEVLKKIFISNYC